MNLAKDNLVALDKNAGEVERQYKSGIAYLRQMNYLTKWPEYERFRAGDQWPAVTKNTAHLPRPVFNLIKMVESHKVANVMSEQINMVFSAEEIEDAVPIAEDMDIGQLFSRYSTVTWERIKQDELNEEALEVGANTGTSIMHYYWDGDRKGGSKLPWIGEMDGEVLDPINVFFGNPQQRDVQKQPWIIISSRESLRSVQDYAKANGVSAAIAKTIKPDDETNDEGYDMAKVEMSDAGGKVTVLTKYWRDKGEIWFTRTCSGITIKAPVSTDLTLYPLAVMQWERRRKSIHGIGETEGLIPNQKSVNTLIGMSILATMLTSWPKVVYKNGAIDPEKVTNQPGEMIEDRSPPASGDGIKYLAPVVMNGNPTALVEAILGYTRQMTGADEAATGTAPSAQLNATAIMLLQKAAGIPIESIKRRFYRFIEDVGRIWEDFWKVKYNLPRQVTMKNDDNEEFGAEFTGADFADQRLNLKIDVGPSSTYSESLMVQSLSDALAGGHITYEQFLQYAPKPIVPFRDRLLKDLEDKKGVVGLIEKFVQDMEPQEKEQFQTLQPMQQMEIIMQVLGPQIGMQPPLDPNMAPQPQQTLPDGAPMQPAVDPAMAMPVPAGI